MFQTTCLNCKGLIKSPLLVEVETIECPHCGKTGIVKDVIVATKNFSMHRNDLLKRVARFKSILGEVEKEIQLIEKDETFSDVSRKSVHKFHGFLKEMMLGARDSFRLEVPDNMYVEIDESGKKRLAKLLNISSAGASIELLDKGFSPDKNSEIQFNLLLPGHLEELSLFAKVAWKKTIEKDHKNYLVLGVQFKKLDEETKTMIFNFIKESIVTT